MTNKPQDGQPKGATPQDPRRLAGDPAVPRRGEAGREIPVEPARHSGVDASADDGLNDGLDDLRAAFASTTPRPDPAVKAAHMAAAREIFAKAQAARQGSLGQQRHSSSSLPKVGWLDKGLNAMTRTLRPLKAGLVASTALVAVGIVAFVPETRSLFTRPHADEALLQGQPVEAPRPRPQEPEVQVTAGTEPAPRQEAPAEEVAAKVAGADSVADAARQAPEASGGGAAARDADMVTAEIAAAPQPSPAAPVERRARVSPPLAAAPPSYMPGVAPAPAPAADAAWQPPADTEEFANKDANPVKVVAEEPVSTFSIDVDTASWGVVRSSLSFGQLPPPEAVRVEEMINYFPYAYAAPEGPDPFQPTVTVIETPWNPGTRLVQIGLQGALPAVEDRPPLNLVFLIDTSGSMNAQNKLPLLVQSFKLMLGELRPEDQIAIVTYAGAAGVVLEPTAAGERSKILEALERLSAGGSTAGAAGLERAYALAEEMHGDGDVSRILLATDGDFNVGIRGADALETYITGKRDKGIYLSVLGFGRGNLNDATMQALAQNGNGTASYIDTLSEARKVLVDELTGALFPIADDVKVQVEFNPGVIAEYRLIGYETRALRREDFNNDKVDAGEIGAGVQMTALYEVTPVGSPAILNDALRYAQAPAAEVARADEQGFLRLRYKTPGEDVSKLIEVPIPAEASAGGDDQRFAAAIAGFGQLLRGSGYLGGWGYADAVALATGARGEDVYGYRAEAIQLMRLAESLSGR